MGKEKVSSLLNLPLQFIRLAEDFPFVPNLRGTER